MRYCAVMPSKQGKNGEKNAPHATIITHTGEKVKQKNAKSQPRYQISIFIDEKIYSVNRQKKCKEQQKADGFTYSQVWQKRKKNVWLYQRSHRHSRPC